MQCIQLACLSKDSFVKASYETLFLQQLYFSACKPKIYTESVCNADVFVSMIYLSRPHYVTIRWSYPNRGRLSSHSSDREKTFPSSFFLFSEHYLEGLVNYFRIYYFFFFFHILKCKEAKNDQLKTMCSSLDIKKLPIPK